MLICDLSSDVSSSYLCFEVALARSLGVSGYGAFSFGLALAGLASRLGPLGWHSTSTRLVSSYVSLRKDGLLKGSLIVAHAATAVGLAAALPLLIVASPSADPSAGDAVLPYRSAERRVGKGGVSTGRY